MKKKGSVTLFVSLLMAVLLGVFQILFYSLRIAGGRVQAEAGVEEGLYSVFSGFHRELFEKYRVFFLDGGYGTDQFRPDLMLAVAENCLKDSMYAGNRGNLWNCSYKSAAITGYTLATDENGRAFWQQAADAVKDTLGIQGIQLLFQKLSEEKELIREQEVQADYEHARKAQDEYEKRKEEQQKAAESENGDDAARKEELPDVPADFQNPLDVIQKVREMGLLGLVFPENRELSQKRIARDEQPSQRELEYGMGVPAISGSENTTDDVLFLHYIMTHMGNFARRINPGGLDYQVEYILGGKESDEENLKVVVRELLAIRTAANMVYLLTDSGKQTQIHQMTLMIASAVGMPFLDGIIALALQAAWAFGESILDIGSLLEGGSVPLVKDGSSWRLSLEKLAKVLEVAEEKTEKQQKGLDYTDYLYLLLFLENRDTRIMRTMDVVEQVIRAGGEETFCIDRCVYALEVEMQVQCEQKEYRIMRAYGYGM